MVIGNVAHHTPDSPIGDIAYLARSEHRVPALVALTERPRSRSELCELTGVSSSTMRRTLDEFEDRIWIRKDGYQYVATRLGEEVAFGVESLIERIETERKIRHIWHWLPDELSAFPIETWAALTVTVADPDFPYRPVNRFESLLREATTVRSLRPEISLMEPCFDVLRRLVDDGVDITLIDRPTCHTYFFSRYPEHSPEMVERDNFTVLAHDDLPPYGIGLLDTHATISCFEPGSGTVQALIDTDAPAVLEWAESLYERYEAEGRPVEARRIVE
ncbi:helix-turn-helix transcriptional regulator [Natronosalvus vescus]|uniref:helix-turn-helix transcriptional regulator n=1 Tax=Natronosalvus vescus TaxID=2953881 RepID=UPI0020916260|nr:MarR family transcriptional regulator [Natronosalvus vescus]